MKTRNMSQKRGVTMGRIALTPCDTRSRGIYLHYRGIPQNYMADFTILGFVVKHYKEALCLLVDAGFQVYEQNAGADIRIYSPQQLIEIKTLFSKNNLDFEFRDIADTIYQA